MTQKNVWNHWENTGNTDAKVMIVSNISTDKENFLNLAEEEQIKNRINQRFLLMNRMVKGMLHGTIRSLIISGAPGIGKTFDVERILKDSTKTHSDFIKGTISAIGLYTALYNAKDNGIVVLDDCDKVFKDEEALNILKAALDSSEVRTISWRKASSWLSNDEQNIPTSFDFRGGVIFITNLDFEEKIQQETKMSPHYEALMSRSLYLDLTLKTAMDKYIRIKDIFPNKMAKVEGLKTHEVDEILIFIKDNKDDFIELSLRTVKHISQLYKFGSDWKEIVKLTKFKK